MAPGERGPGETPVVIVAPNGVRLMFLEPVALSWDPGEQVLTMCWHGPGRVCSEWAMDVGAGIHLRLEPGMPPEQPEGVHIHLGELLALLGAHIVPGGGDARA